jgi:hypothetical protein
MNNKKNNKKNKKNKQYTATNDTSDVPNFVEYRVPLLEQLFKKHDLAGTGDDIRNILTFQCHFTNTWKSEGADDIRMLPIGPVGSKQIMFTALKKGKVLKQTMLCLVD